MLPKPRKPVDPRWQPNWEDLTDADRVQFKAWCEEIKSLLPPQVEIVDYQLVGSRARGNNEADSDYDVVFVPKDNRYHRTHPRAAMLRAKEISEANGISLFIGIGPSAKQLVCYSFLDGKFHGKAHGQKVNKKVRFHYKLRTFKEI